MSCVMEFRNSLTKAEFRAEDNKQKIIIDILCKHSEMNADKIALILGISKDMLNDVYHGKNFLDKEEADDLAQLFLMFLGKNFFRECIVARNFTKI